MTEPETAENLRPDAAEAAQALASAERDRLPIDPITRRWPRLTVTDAYAVQRANITGRCARGSRVRGHKVGLTSAAMQQMLGVDQPDFGHLLDDMFVPEGGTVPARRYLQPRVEAEIGFTLGADLTGPGVTAEDVLAATATVHPAIEIIDSRIADWQITLIDTVADNGSSGGVVLGPGTPLAELNTPLTDLGGELLIDGTVAESGTGAAVLGHPAAAVAWLANTLAEFGATLATGHVVLPGAIARAVTVSRGTRASANFDQLGTASVTFT